MSEKNTSIETITILTNGTTVKGKISSEGDMRIDGDIKGSIDCAGKVVLGESSKLEVTLASRQMNLNGTLTGDITIAEHLTIGSTGVIEGSVQTHKLSVAQGAVINGDITMPQDNKDKQEA